MSVQKIHSGVFIEAHRVVHAVLLEPLFEKAQWLVLPLFLLIIVAITGIVWLILFRAVRTCPSAVGLIPLVLLVLLHLERVALPHVGALLLPCDGRRIVARLEARQ